MNPGRRRRWITTGSAAVAVAAVTSVVAACGSTATSSAAPSGSGSSGSSASNTGGAAASGPLASYETGLSGVCPSNINVQVNWWPSSDDAFLFDIIGSNGTTDTSKNTYSGPIGNSGVTLTIESGGPGASYQTDTALAYENDPYLFMESTDEQISNSAQHPTTAVFDWYQQYPLIFLWGNQKWNFTSMQQIAASGTKVLAFSSGTYLGLFEKEGLLAKAQVDTSYNGAPARFVAADGNIIQQGFVDEEPYQLQYETPAWGKPVKFLLVGNKDFPVYQDEIAVRPDKLAAETPCLKKLIPLFQAASVHYAKSPADAEAAIVKFTNSLKGTGVAVSAGLADYAYQAQLKYGLIANGTDGTYGSFDAAEVQSAITKLTPVFEGEGIHPKAGLKPSDLYTNEFLDPSIKLPG
jgi:hypothetical protein